MARAKARSGSTRSKSYDSNRKTFTDLAPEIRLRIYCELFDGQTITIRRNDNHFDLPDGPDYEAPLEVPHKAINRDRAIGTNLMFTSRALLPEVKAAILALAKIDLSMNSLLRLRGSRDVVPQQGFSELNLQHVRKLEIGRLMDSIQKSFYKRLATMRSLHDLTVSDWEIGESPIDPTTFGTHDTWTWEWHILWIGFHLAESVGQDMLREVVDHLQNSAHQVNREARLVIKYPVLGSISSVEKGLVMCAELFSGYAWVESARAYGTVLFPEWKVNLDIDEICSYWETKPTISDAETKT